MSATISRTADGQAQPIGTAKTKAAANRMDFTDKSVKGLKADPKKKKVRWEKGLPGFGIRVSPQGKKTWIAMKRNKPKVSGATRHLAMVTLGEYPRMTLAEAHRRFIEVKDAASDGVDLRVRKRSQSGVFTFANLCDLYLTDHLIPHRREKTVKVAKQLMQVAIQRWGNRPADKITKPDVLSLHEEIASRPRLRNYARFEGRGAVV
jgi:hypothetical protein